MTSKPVVRQAIEDSLEEPIRLTPVSKSVYNVYEVTTGKEWYAKIIPDRKHELVATLVGIDTEIGMPESRMLSGEVNIHLLQPAEGRELAQTLLWSLAPVVWATRRHKITAALTRLGRCLGVLHKQTYTGEESLAIDTLHMDRYNAIDDGEVNPSLTRILAPETRQNLKYLSDEYNDRSYPVTTVHGDLMLFHVYVSGSDISLIDFDRAKRAHPIEDIATFQSALELFVRRLPYARWAQFEQLRSAFYDGYMAVVSDWTVNPQRVAFFRALRHCSLLVYYQTRIDDTAPLKHRLLKRYDVPILARAVRAGLQETSVSG